MFTHPPGVDHRLPAKFLGEAQATGSASSWERASGKGASGEQIMQDFETALCHSCYFVCDVDKGVCLQAAMSGLTHWTVGLVATLMAVCCVIAADVGAYLCGKSMGRTKLSAISPKKTVEGALGGLLCSIATALSFWRLFQWPAHPAVAAALGVLVFFASLFGDLIESVMKRDAGLKDASDLIPGHGGLLDRFDSYIFTGAIVYFQLKFVVPMFGL